MRATTLIAFLLTTSACVDTRAVLPALYDEFFRDALPVIDDACIDLI